MNSQLKDKKYRLPKEVLKHIRSVLTQYPHGDGVRRAKHMLRNGEITYQAMKRLKNFFDNYSPENDKRQYELAGGDLMKQFVDSTLNRDRAGVEVNKKVKSDLDVDVKQGVKPDQNLRLNENIDNKNIKQENALAVIINSDEQVLILKRSPDKEYWGAGQWALVGGKIEEGETPVEACQREIREETSLRINEFKETFKIQRRPDSVEHIFVARYNGDPDDVSLNKEHTNYCWCLPEEIVFLNAVPNLLEYVKIAFEKYY